MTGLSVATIAPRPKPEPERDRWGRYIILNADGQPDVYRRATSVAHKLGSSEGLEYWKRTMVASGMGQVPELPKLAAAHPDPKLAKSVYREILDAADEASGANAARRRGQAMHALTEHLDRGAQLCTSDLDGTWWLVLVDGQTVIPVEPDDAGRLLAYKRALEDHGISILEGNIEQVLILDGLRIAGTADRIARLRDGRLVVLDLKTGGLEYGHLEWAAQLAVYANHDAQWCHREGDLWEREPPIPNLDREWGVVVHLPATGDPECTIHWLDLEAGYGGLIYAAGLMEYQTLKVMTPFNGGLLPERKAVRLPEAPEWAPTEVEVEPTTAEPMVSTEEGTPENIRAWLAERLEAMPPTVLTMVLDRWPSTVPIPLPATLLAHQVEDVARLLDIVEREHQIPFPRSRPGLTVAQVKATRVPRPATKATPRPTNKAAVKAANTRKPTSTKES